MSAPTSANSDLFKEIKSHEVALAELGCLSSSRTVYQRSGNLFFRTTVQKATVFEQQQLEAAKARDRGRALQS